MDKAVVLLSGGMDSVVALYWAIQQFEVSAIMNFSYGQNGHELEYAAAVAIVDNLRVQGKLNNALTVTHVPMHIPVYSSLTHKDSNLHPARNDRYGQPMTFVPGRNLIFISYAIAVAYDVDATKVVGGWSGVDVDYPDCSLEFLHAISIAGSIAIGRTDDRHVVVSSPLSRLSKMETVKMGEHLNVPWGLTRSCYSGLTNPCMICASCRLRAEAFNKAGIHDPLVEVITDAVNGE